MNKIPIHPVRQLYEFPNADPKFDEAAADEDVKCVPLRFMCNGILKSVHGFGVNKEDAKLAAATLALSKLKCSERK